MFDACVSPSLWFHVLGTFLHVPLAQAIPSAQKARINRIPLVPGLPLSLSAPNDLALIHASGHALVLLMRRRTGIWGSLHCLVGGVQCGGRGRGWEGRLVLILVPLVVVPSLLGRPAQVEIG